MRFRQSQISFHFFKKKNLQNENISVLQINTKIPANRRGKTGKNHTWSKGNQTMSSKKLRLYIKFTINWQQTNTPRKKKGIHWSANWPHLRNPEYILYLFFRNLLPWFCSNLSKLLLPQCLYSCPKAAIMYWYSYGSIFCFYLLPHTYFGNSGIYLWCSYSFQDIYSNAYWIFLLGCLMCQRLKPQS